IRDFSARALARSARRIPVDHPKLKKMADDALEMATGKHGISTGSRLGPRRGGYRPARQPQTWGRRFSTRSWGGPGGGGHPGGRRAETDWSPPGKLWRGALPATPHRDNLVSRALAATSVIAMSDMQEPICGSAVVPYKITDLRDRAAA